MKHFALEIIRKQRTNLLFIYWKVSVNEKKKPYKKENTKEKMYKSAAYFLRNSDRQ